MTEKEILLLIIGALTTLIIWGLKEVVTRYLNNKKEEKDFKLKLLEEVYSYIVTINQSVKLEKDIDINSITSKLGFNLQVYFPTLLNKNYENFLSELLLFKNEVNLKRINNELNDSYADEYLKRQMKTFELSKKILDDIVTVANEIKL